MRQVQATQAKAHLAALLREVERGETIVLDLAKRTDGELATLDRALHMAAVAEGVSVMGDSSSN